MIVGHGGNIYDKARKLGCAPMDVLDMSSNVNPLGPLPGLIHHLTAHMDRIAALPEAGAESIIQLFSEHYQIDPKKVLAGNGTTQLIYTLPYALNIKQALILGPTYSDYADACRMNGAAYRFALTDADRSFHHDLHKIEKELGSSDAVFICNPNNPTGVLIPDEEIRFLCQKHPDILFIIDESYLPFVSDGESRSLMTSSQSNVLVLNSMSKIFRVPGLRIGFIIASAPLIEKIGAYTLPWSVNAMAQTAVEYLMTRKQAVSDFIEMTRKFLSIERQFVLQNLQYAQWITLFPSQTSFILAELKKYTSEEISGILLDDRILIRDCSNFQGLSNRFIRISLKTRDINQLLVDRLNFFCNRPES